jgi:hypothetical protein
MTQSAMLRAIDADLIAGLVSVGMGDAAIYTPPGTTPTPVDCDVLVDDIVLESTGESARTVGTRREVTFQRAQVTPVRGGVVEIDEVSWRLESLEQQDASISRWTVIRVRA